MRAVVLILMFALFRRFGGAGGIKRLGPDEVAGRKRATRSTSLWFFPGITLVSLCFWGAAAYGLIAFRLSLDSPCTNPFLDERRSNVIGSLAFCGFLGFAHSLLTLHGLLFGRAAGLDPGLWHRWYATQWDAIPSRASLLSLAFFIPLSLLPLALAWSNGDRVCDEGISFSPGLLSRFEFTYAEVASIALDDARNVQGSVRDQPNVVVEFTNGDRWEYAADPSGKDVTAAAIADHVARKSGRPVTRAAMKP